MNHVEKELYEKYHTIFEEDDITYIEDCDESLLTLDNDAEIPDYWEDSYFYF